MENRFRRKLAAFLAAVMFTTSLPMPVIAEDSAETVPVATVETIPESTAETTMVVPTEPETVPTTVPETEPETEPATEPATEPDVQPEEEKTQPEKSPVEQTVTKGPARSLKMGGRMAEPKAQDNSALAEGPSFTAERNNTNGMVFLTVTMEGATHFRMLYGETVQREYEANNGTLNLGLRFTEATTVCFSACVDGVWTANGPAQEIEAMDMPALGRPVLVLPETIRSGEDIELIWESVENAEYYYVNVYTVSDHKYVWSDNLNAATEECRSVIPAGELKQGSYYVSMRATASGYYEGMSGSVLMEVGAPLPGNEFDYTISSDGTEVYLYGYLGDPIPAELEIPATISGGTVVGMYGGCFKNAVALKKISIPASVTYIADNAFEGCTDLTIRGYSGSEAEAFAVFNGFTFEALDGGESAVTAVWTDPVVVYKEMTFTISAPGATDMRMYDEWTYQSCQVHMAQNGATILWTPEETGSHIIHFEALIGGEWISSKFYTLNVTSAGTMPPVTNLKLSSATIEPGTAVTLSWTAPEGVTAPEYSVGILPTGDDYTYWYDVSAGKSTYTFGAFWFEEEGSYTLYVRVKGTAGMESSVTSCTVEVKSTQLWDYNASNKTLLGYNGTDTEITIPSEINGQPVLYLGSSLFADSDITSVTIPEGVKSVGWQCFYNCKKLTTVNLPSTLTEIGNVAFSGCTALTQIQLPAGLTTLDSSAFYGCDSLTSVVIPEKIKVLEQSVFSSCDSLTRVTLPENLTTIEGGAFSYCKQLKTITIPQSVNSISQYAFQYVEGLTIQGYSGSAAETFAREQGYTFVALGAADTGDISFALKNDKVYQNGYLNITVTAPDAEKLRVYLDNNVTEYSISNGKAELSLFAIYSLGEHSVTVSQCVDGKWLAPCETQTFTVIEMPKPVIEPIDPTPAGSPVLVRWKPVEGAESYTLYVSKDTVHIADFQNVQNLDKDGYLYQQLEASLLTIAGYYDLQVTAHVTEGGNSYGQLSFEITEAEEFFYEVNSDGTATLTGCNSTAQTVTVPDQLDGHAVVTIAEKAFLNTPAVTIVLPVSVQLVEQWAFYGCEALETVKILDAQATIRQFAFEDCDKLVGIYLGKGVFADANAFVNCRADTVIYGYSGGQVEEVARAAHNFSSLGELAAGPVVTAENIWQHEELNYSVSYENASKLYIQEIYPDGNVESSTRAAAQLEDVADSYSFADLTEDSQVTIKAAALVNGEWTAYTEKKVTVSVLKELTAPVFEEIGSLERHVDQIIKWYPVEDAQQYRVIISSGMHVVDYDETVTVPEIALKAGSLQEGNYTIRVTAMAEGCEDATGSAEFEVISLKLNQPVITVDSRIARYLGATISWEPVPVAENYTVVVQTEGINGPLTIYRNTKLTETEVTLTPEQLKVGNCTVSVTANALYCTSSDTATAEFEIYEEQLDATAITAPEAVVGGVAFNVTWKSVDNAEKYHLEIMNGDDYRVFYKTVDSNTLSQTILLDAYLPEETLTLRVIASANYRVDGVAEQPLSYKPLYSYEIVDNAAVITGYNGPDTELSVPGQIKGYDVTAIGDDAFAEREEITKVWLPESVASIGDRSFKNCTALQWIEGEGVKEIGSEAFCNCTSLTHIRFGGNDAEVKAEPDAFENTPVVENGNDDSDKWLEITISPNTEPGDYSYSLFLGSVTYEEGITHIPDRAHYSNLMLREVMLPKSLRTIGSESFAECPVLDFMRIYDGITDIADDAFENAPNLCLHIYTADYDTVSYVEQYAIDHNISYVKHDLSQRYFYTLTYPAGTVEVEEKDCFEDDYLLKIILPETVKTIEAQAFAQCEALNEISLYDGITSIADDAFEGSDGVQFTLYVRDLDTVSYAEQYAIDHEIPYEKHLLPGSSSPVVNLRDGDTSLVIVNIDEPVFIRVEDIPAEADRLLVYLDEELIFAPALDQNTTIQFTHIFRDFGEHTLTAEAYQGDEKIKTSLEKPVTVVGIRLQADRESAWTCETVNFTVEAYPDTDELSFYAEELLFGTVRLTNNTGSFAYAFTEAGEREITVRSADGRVSGTLTLSIQCIGQLEQPALEAEELQYVNDGLTCSWNTTENTDGYVLYVRYANGQDILQRKIADDGSDRMSCSISAEELGGEGTYQLYLMNYGYKYDQNESETITVELTADKTPRFTMDKQTVTTGDPVVFTFRAADATSVELWADGKVIETVSLTNGRGTLTRAFTQSGDRKMQIRALQDGAWTDLSEIQILKVTSKGALAAVQVTAEPIQLLGNSIKASWTAVANADGYIVYFRNAAHETIYQQDTKECAVSVPADLVQQTGEYYFMVVAYGKGYDQSEGGADVTVMDHLPGPVIVTPTENEICTNTSVKLTWQAVTGAESYVVSLARKTDRVDAAGQHIFEKVWAAPNETVNVGTDLSYDLTGLIYGGEYRVAVGTVSTLDGGEQCIGWTERQFSVQMPELSVTLAANTLTPNEGGQVILTAVANHPMTQAVLTDETGAVVETVSSTSEVVNGTRVFTFVVAAVEPGEKTYMVTVSGTDEMEGQTALPASVTVIVQAKGKLPAPNVTNLSNGDIVPSENYVVKWDPVVLGEDMTFGGYSVSVYYLVKAGVPGETFDDWDPLPGCDKVFVGNQCSYTLPAMDPTKLYRVEIYTVPEDTEIPSQSLSGCTAINFTYRTIPTFSLTAVETTKISKQPVTVRWNAPVWSLDPSMKPSSYVIHWYRGSENIYSQKIGGDKLEATLPGEYVLDGVHTVDVYAMLDSQQQKADGNNAFEIVPSRVTIDKYGDGAATLTAFPGEPITISGTATGGITKVLAILIPAGGKPEDAYALKSANGTEVKMILADVVDGVYTLKLDPVKDLEISEGDKTNHAIEVYGFLTNIDTVIGQHADSTWAMVDVDGGAIFSITSNTKSPNNWVFIGENAHIDVTTNKAVKNIRLSDGKTPLGLAIDKVDKYADRNEFGADFQSSVEGLHVITAADANTQSDAEPKSVNVYVVTPTNPNVEVHCKPNVTTKGWIIPVEGYSADKAVTITEKTKLIQRGKYGDFILVKVNDGDSFFVHKDYLDLPESEIVLIYPTEEDTIILSEVDEFVIRWTPKTGAKSYNVKLTTHYVNRQGKESSVEIFTKTVTATNDPEQTLPVTSSVILNKVKPLSSIINTDWVTDIEITANS